jgi:hypothetical protein
MAKPVLVLAVAGLVVLGAAGCTAGGGFPIFDREPTDADALPNDFPAMKLDDYDLDSLRFVGTHDDVDLFVVRMVDGQPCLLIASDARSSISCGGGGSVETSVGGGDTYRLGPAPMILETGWTTVGENVAVHDE